MPFASWNSEPLSTVTLWKVPQGKRLTILERAETVAAEVLAETRKMISKRVCLSVRTKRDWFLPLDWPITLSISQWPKVERDSTMRGRRSMLVPLGALEALIFLCLHFFFLDFCQRSLFVISGI